MKKSLVLVIIINLLFACNKKGNNLITDAQSEIIDSTIINNSPLKKDEMGITDYVIESSVNTNCEAYFLSILNSSKQYKNDTKNLDQNIKINGGIGLNVKLEKEENIVKYVVSEAYSDKNTVINTYFFNITNNKLYIEDFIISGVSQEIDFDQNLLNKNTLNCIK